MGEIWPEKVGKYSGEIVAVVIEVYKKDMKFSNDLKQSRTCVDVCKRC